MEPRGWNAIRNEIYLKKYNIRYDRPLTPYKNTISYIKVDLPAFPIYIGGGGGGGWNGGTLISDI